MVDEMPLIRLPCLFSLETHSRKEYFLCRRQKKPSVPMAMYYKSFSQCSSKLSQHVCVYRCLHRAVYMSILIYLFLQSMAYISIHIHLYVSVWRRSACQSGKDSCEENELDKKLKEAKLQERYLSESFSSYLLPSLSHFRTDTPEFSKAFLSSLIPRDRQCTSRRASEFFCLGSDTCRLALFFYYCALFL